MISIICCLKDTGMPIKQIKSFIDWQMTGDSTLHKRNDMLIEHQKFVIQQIENLQKNLSLMEEILNNSNVQYFALRRPLTCEPNLINRW